MAILYPGIILMVVASIVFAASENISAILQDDVVMKCPFSSKSKSVIWFGPGDGKLTTFVVGDKINKNIRNYDRLRVVGDHTVGEYNLQILNISTEDAGLYKCHSIQNGTAVEATFKLSIIEKPRTLQNKSFFQIKTQTGKPAIIEIEVESLTKPYVSWATNPGGKLGVWTASSDIFPNYVLKSTIVPKLKSHFGKYGIKVRNAAGSIDLDIELKLKDYPVMVHPAVVYCNASTLATLSCEIHADDFDQWQNVWTQTRNGQFIKDIIGNVNGNISSIDINYCDYIEEGDYKCTWKSKLKTYSATSVVKTNGPPTITESIYLVEKSIFCLAIRFYAQAGYIEIRWFKNDQIIENSTEIDISLEPSAVSLNYSGRYIRENGYISKLCMEGFTYNDIFQYSCQIINKYGSIEFSFHVDWIYQRYQQFLSRTEEMTVSVGAEEFEEHAEGNSAMKVPVVEDTPHTFRGISTIVFVLIGAGVFMCGMVIVIIMVCYCKSSEKDVVIRRTDRLNSSVEDTPMQPEYEEIEIDVVQETHDSSYEVEVEQGSIDQTGANIVPSDNPVGDLTDAPIYLEIQEGGLEIHAYTECKTLYN